MNDSIAVALSISALGMLLLFGALLLLYGLMMALTAVARDRGQAPTPADRSPRGGHRVRRARVAAIAVALARAERERSAAPPPETVQGWSPWRAFHTHRVLGLQGTKRGRR
ncbi:MAG: hypothetical protein PVI59_09730 [Anaerolineae bacterium]